MDVQAPVQFAMDQEPTTVVPEPAISVNHQEIWALNAQFVEILAKMELRQNYATNAGPNTKPTYAIFVVAMLKKTNDI